jgi:hypothetical protein
MYRKNTAGQYIGFVAVNATTGAAMSGTTGFAAYRCLDGGAQASAGGTVTDKGNGQYSFALAQADTNGNDCSILFTMTGMVPVEKTFVTTACDPTAATNFGITSLPSTSVTTNASLLTSGTGTDQISVSAGKVLLQATQTGVTIPTVTTVTTTTNLTNAPTTGDFTSTMKTSIGTAVAASNVAGVTGVTFPATVASPTNITAATGVVLSGVTHTGAVIPTVTNLTNLPAITTDWITAAGVSSAAVTKIQSGLSTYSGGDTSGTTTLLARLTSTRAGLMDNLDAAMTSRLAPTVAGRTLDVSATGEAGVDWANVGSPTTTLNLSGTTISTSQAVASVSGSVGSVASAVTLPSIPANWITGRTGRGPRDTRSGRSSTLR